MMQCYHWASVEEVLLSLGFGATIGGGGFAFPLEAGFKVVKIKSSTGWTSMTGLEIDDVSELELDHCLPSSDSPHSVSGAFFLRFLYLYCTSKRSRILVFISGSDPLIPTNVRLC